MDNNMKRKIAGGMKWSSIESFGTTGMSFVISIIIARRLIPADYGVMGMLTIFLALSNTFLNSGISSALIQKKDVNNDDYSTAFYFNMMVGIGLYGILYFAAPFIAEFYNQPILTPVTRVISTTLIISALSMVQGTILSIKLDFRSKARNSLVSVIFSGIAGIIMAYNGFGVWALVWQGVLSGIIMMVLLWYYSSWKPSFTFKKKSFKALFGFGSKHLVSSTINTIYDNLSTIVIGKVYQASDLGYYTRANSISTLPGSFIMNTIQKVNYPVLAKLQDDNVALLSMYSILLRAPLFLIFPILFGMAALAWPLIEVLLGERWLPSAGMLIIACFGCLSSPLSNVNLNLLYVKGRTDLVLKLELMKKPIAFIMIIAAIPTGIYGMCTAMALYNYVAFCFNCHYTGKILNYGLKKQVMDILPILLYSLCMAACVVVATIWLPYAWLKLMVGIPVGIIIYIMLAKFNNDKTLMSLAGNVLTRFPSIRVLNYIVK